MAKKQKAVATGKKSLAAHRISIKNFMGIDELEFNPSKITLIKGRNAAGKSSIVKAIKSVVEGGHDATLIREGAKEAQIGIVLENGTRIEKRITRERSNVDVDYAGVFDDEPPMAYVNKLSSRLAVWPLRFIDEPKKRLEWVLESIGGTPTEDVLHEITRAISAVSDEIPERMRSLPVLTLLDKLEKPIYDRRTELNREAKQKRSTIEQLFEQLPDQKVDIDELREDLELEKESGRELVQLRDDDIKVITDAAGEKIVELERQITELQSRIMRTRNRRDELIKAKQDEYRTRIQESAVKVRELESKLESAARTNNTLDIANKMVAEAEAVEDSARRHNQAIDSLRFVKKRVLDAIPIPGVTIDEGDIYKDGIPFDNLNRQAQLEIVLHIAVMNAGSLGLVCLDGFEALDEASREHVFDWIGALDREDIKFIFTQVADQDLNIEDLA